MKTVVRQTTLADRLLLALLVAACIAGVFASREAVSHSPDVVVEVDGRVRYTFPLSTDHTFTVAGISGPAVVEIRSGRVRMKEADCPNRICVKEGWITRGVIVCLPNRIVISVGGRHGRPADGLDAVTG